MVSKNLILTDAEKNYLMTETRTDKISNRELLSIKKVFDPLLNEFYLVFRYDGKIRAGLGFVDLFKGLELDREYTIRELRL